MVKDLSAAVIAFGIGWPDQVAFITLGSRPAADGNK
jgi:hypothetical protein